MVDKPDKKIVVLTGSGISAESGIPTFRDSGGLWEGFDIEDVATPEAWARDQDKVLSFYNERRKNVRDAEPNAAHKALAELEKTFPLVVITQNIDDLHERAGSKNVLHLHGEITKARSSHSPELITTIGFNDIMPGQKAEDGSQLRPHVVWFGEAVPMMEVAMRETAEATVLIVIGTSLAVYPAASLIDFVPAGCEIIVIDRQIPHLGAGRNIRTFEMEASRGVPELVHEWTKRN